MGATTKPLKLTVGNVPTPQSFDTAADDWVPNTGVDGVPDVGIARDDVGLAKDGTDATGVTPPAGGGGIRGWLSGIYDLLHGGNAKVQVQNFPGTQAVSAADGSQVTIGAKADAAATDSTSAWSVVALLKGLRNLLAGVLSVSVTGSTFRQPASGDDKVSSLVVEALARALRLSDGKLQSLVGDVDASGNLILLVHEAAPVAYDPTYDARKNSIIRSEPVQVTTHNAVSIAANSFGTEVAVSMKGYRQAIIFIKSDKAYDLTYRVSDGVVGYGASQGTASLVTGQAATGNQGRPHPLVSGGVWLFGDTLYVMPKNTDASLAATMTVTVYLIP